MNVIDITSELKRFETHLENNPRSIFSAKFGDGKKRKTQATTGDRAAR